MSDLDFEDSLIAGAVADYREATMSHIKPAGATAAVATATHRRNLRIAGVAALAATIIIGTGTAYAALSHDGNAPPVIGVSNNPSPEPTDRPSVEPSAGTSATATAPTKQAPHDLRNATLDLPKQSLAVDCPHGPTKFTNGRAGKFTTIEKVLSADVDGDGVADDVALINCRPGEGALKQAVAFHRNADGTFSTIGLVTQIAGDIKNVQDMTVSGSAVLVKVGNYETTFTDGSRAKGVYQWRTYGWNGSKFAQTKGSTSFLADTSANHLTTTVSTLVYDKPSGGKRHGTMTVKVRNTGTKQVTGVSLVMVMPDVPTLTSSGCTGETYAPTCQLGTLAPGATATVRFDTSMSVADADYYIAHGGPDLQFADAQVRIGDQKYSDHNGLTVTFN